MNGAPRQDHVDLELRDYAAVLRRRWRVIIAFVLLCGVVAVGLVLFQPKRYEATASVLLDTGYSRTILYTADDTSVPNIDEQVITEVDLMRSRQVTDSITKRLGFEPDVEVESVESSREVARTRSIAVVASASTRARAERDANGFSEAYVEVRRKIISEDLASSIEQNNASLRALDRSTANSQQRIDQLDILIPAAKQGTDRLVLEAERARLADELSSGSIATRQTEIQTRLDLLRSALQDNEQKGIFRVTVSKPAVQTRPLPVRYGIIALLAGLSLGIVAAFLRDYIDDSMRTKEDLDAATGGVPVLSLIPAVPGWRNRDETHIESMSHPHSATSEAYRSFRTAIEFAAIEHKIGLIHITSSTSGEGKTTTAANLAVALASTGKRVVLVDCDLRRPRVHKFFGMDNSVGFTSVLVGEIGAQDALQEVEGVPRLLVLSSGPRPPNPSELLSTKAAQNLLKTLGTFADNVVIDSPPLLPVADSSLLAGFVDATVLVVAAKSTTRRSLRRSLELLAQVNAPLEGILFNGIGHDAAYGYGYGYGYGSEEEATGRGGRKKKMGTADHPDS